MCGGGGEEGEGLRFCYTLHEKSLGFFLEMDGTFA